MKKLLIIAIVFSVSCQNKKTGYAAGTFIVDSSGFIGECDTVYIHDTIYTSQRIEKVENLYIDQR